MSIYQPHRIICEIKIKEHLEERWSTWFDGLDFTHKDNDTTTLSGPLKDQAALHSILLKIRDMNLTLISFTQSESKPDQESQPN